MMKYTLQLPSLNVKNIFSFINVSKCNLGDLLPKNCKSISGNHNSRTRIRKNSINTGSGFHFTPDCLTGAFLYVKQFRLLSGNAAL